jgi:hypothetical protein
MAYFSNSMHIFDYFKKKTPEKVIKQVELSKIDKHVNLILREKLASNNRTLTDTLTEFDGTKQKIIHKLRELHKKTLMNPNIPRREIQIMEGNRENYVKRVARFITSINAPKQYLELYYYTIQFSEEMDILSKDTQKNMFVLRGFFENELKDINKELNNLEEKMIGIRVMFEKHNIQRLQEVVNNIEKIKQNLAKTIKLREEMREHEATIKDYEDKIQKLEERVHTITTGTDFRALENFKTDKENVDNEIKKIFKEFDTSLSGIDTALKKYYYKNQDKKIIKEYLDEPYKTLLKDRDLEIERIIKEIKENLDDIDLKDKKKEHVQEILSKLTFEYLKKTQVELMKLEDQKQHMQTKITHNSASLNLSEQQYWMKANQDKIRTQNEAILKLESDLERFEKENNALRTSIHEEIERILGENIDLKDDLLEYA